MKDLTYYHDRGVDLIRLPFRWERMQHSLGGPLDTAELGRMKAFLANAASLDMDVIVDLHNYGRYNGSVIGGGTVTDAHFADFWKKLATQLKGSPALAGYDLMNEPHGMGGADRWPRAAQAAVDAIRTVDSSHDIYVEGDAWSGAHSWQKYNANLNIKDPADKIIYQAHQYFDANNSGTYQNSYSADGVTPMTGVERLKPFADWLKATGNKGFIGEFAVPDNDPRWLPVLNNFMDAMAANNITGTYWGAGPWWGNYPLALVGGDGKPNPQLQTFLDNVHEHAGSGTPAPSPSPAPEPTPAPAPPPESSPPPSNGATINGTSGNDTLTGGASAETINGHGGNDMLRGGGGNDKLFGGVGNDRLDGDGGADQLTGGSGNDVYFVDNVGDVVVELGGGGTDEVNSKLSYSLAANVENLILRTGANINGTGNELANKITGNSGVNSLNGGSGDDMLHGSGGGDLLTGGAGRDVFDYNSVADSRGSTVDHIRDFVIGTDRIDLSGIDANSGASGNQSFRFVGTGAFSGGAGVVHAVVHGASGGKPGFTVLEGDVNGDRIADFAIHLDGVARPLTSAELVL